MKITVNKAKIKKLASFAKLQKHGHFWNNVFIHNRRAWALNGMAVICCECETTGAESLKIDAHAFFELIEKAGNGKEITIDTDNLGESWYSSTESSFRKIFDELTGAPTMATISRMLWALLQPKGAGERCNLLLTNEQVKAELREQIEKGNGKKEWQFRGGCELAESNQIEKPLLLNISEKKIPPLAKKKSCCFSVVHDKDRNQYYLKYEGEMGEVYLFAPQYEVFKTANKDIFSDEIQAAYQSAIDEMNHKSEPTTEPEPTNIEPEPDKEKEQMQEKKEIEPTEPTMEKPAAESIQNEEIQTSEPTPEPTAATAAESVQNPESEKENRPPIVSKEAPDVSEIIELYKNFDDYKANDKLKKLFLKEQEEKGFLYFSEIVEICKAINAGAWNTFFYCHPMHFGATWNKTPEPGAQVIIGDSVYSCENHLHYSDEERAKSCQICGNVRAQYKIHFWLEVMEPLKPSEKVEKVKNCWDKSRIGNPIVTTPADALNPEVKAMIKTLNDYKRVAGHLYGKSGNYNSPISQCFHYYRDGEEITGKEPGGASRIEDYSIERVPNHNAIIVNFTLTSKKPQPKPEPEKKQEELKPTPAPIEIKREPEPVKAAVASIPAPVVACKVDAPVQIPEPEPKPTTEEPDPEQIDKTKPTGAELRYSLSLLAMPYPIDTLIEKFLKKTNKPVRYSIVEKLLMTIDRGSVPKPGESKREYIKTYYQTH